MLLAAILGLDGQRNVPRSRRYLRAEIPGETIYAGITYREHAASNTGGSWDRDRSRIEAIKFRERNISWYPLILTRNCRALRT